MKHMETVAVDYVFRLSNKSEIWRYTNVQRSCILSRGFVYLPR